VEPKGGFNGDDEAGKQKMVAAVYARKSTEQTSVADEQKSLARFALVRVMFLLPIVLFTRTSSAQPLVADRNAVYVELFGSGGLFSINYEREIVEGIRTRVGFGSWRSQSLFGNADTSITSVPFTVAGLRGRGAHRLELGGGVTVGNREHENIPDASGAFVSLTGVAGYRYHSPGRGFLFRAAVTPFYGFGEVDLAYPEKGFFPSFGISLGYAF